jgi:photosystem II stability/assembly factor-like uncharacterized protein
VHRRAFIAAASAGAFLSGAVARPAQDAPPAWSKLPTEPYRGKQDDVFFVDEATGWYGNGAGKLFRTTDGGATWTQQMDRPGTFVRALGFIDERLGFLGNIGPDYFPNVSDQTPLYRTRDGGESWEPVTIDGPAVKGICAIDVYREPFINTGVVEDRITVRAGGRVGSPAFLATSRDRGESWTSEDLSGLTAMILDVGFVSDQVGFICGASSARLPESHALILRTSDGGRTWSPVYESDRPWELTWKMSWPSEHVGYVTLQNTNRDAPVSQQRVLKSVDGGLTWAELPLVDEVRARQFGVGFVSEDRGWVGTALGGLETIDGGQSWNRIAMGAAVNKIRVIPKQAGGKAIFAIGSELHRLDLPG